MAPSGDKWLHPLTGRYASAEMLELFSEKRTAAIWRSLWLALAETQQDLGLDIPHAAVEQLRSHLDDADLDRVRSIEAETRHDVVAHIRHLAEQAPAASPVIHWGATSCFVADNASLIQMKEALGILITRIAAAVRPLRDFALRYKDLPTLSFTHLQPAQPTTVGKRSALWLYDLLLDGASISSLYHWLPFRSVKGTTGTQASFLQLFNGDYGKVRELEYRIADRMGFGSVVPVSGQTYSRKIDTCVVSGVAGIGETSARFGNDIRFLQHLKEVEEPFRSSQVGSSAMPYKRNPMRSERLCGLGRFLAGLPAQASVVASSQWLERTLDDSAPRRFYIPEAFLLADACLILLANVADGLVVYPEMIRLRLEQELPFMASEALLMAAVEQGGDRQKLHEVIRSHAQAVADRIKTGAAPNDLLDRLENDPAFASVKDRIRELAAPARFVGAAPMQVERFIEEEVDPFLESFGGGDVPAAPEI
ncbi:MAG: adenylosuccinate lyase [Planctomycetes bacterium]|nr:adenylosuccinate lyase [Planctomycetota bacterium]